MPKHHIAPFSSRLRLILAETSYYTYFIRTPSHIHTETSYYTYFIRTPSHSCRTSYYTYFIRTPSHTCRNIILHLHISGLRRIHDETSNPPSCFAVRWVIEQKMKGKQSDINKTNGIICPFKIIMKYSIKSTLRLGSPFFIFFSTI